MKMLLRFTLIAVFVFRIIMLANSILAATTMVIIITFILITTVI